MQLERPNGDRVRLLVRLRQRLEYRLSFSVNLRGHLLVNLALEPSHLLGRRWIFFIIHPVTYAAERVDTIALKRFKASESVFDRLTVF